LNEADSTLTEKSQKVIVKTVKIEKQLL